MDDKLNLTDSKEHADVCHFRWHERLNREVGSPQYLDDWIDDQCGGCRFFITLSGAMGTDYGACTNAASPFDKQVMSEHDGCEAFELASDAWGNTSEETDRLRNRPPEDFKRLAIDALRDNTKLSHMTPEQRELAAQSFDTIGLRARDINMQLAKFLNQERARFFRQKLRYIASTLHEFGNAVNWTSEEYFEGDRVRLKSNHSLPDLPVGVEGIVRVCYNVTPLAYEVTFTDASGKPFDALMYDEELEPCS